MCGNLKFSRMLDFRKEEYFSLESQSYINYKASLGETIGIFSMVFRDSSFAGTTSDHSSTLTPITMRTA
jgi:hypothetical protein